MTNRIPGNDLTVIEVELHYFDDGGDRVQARIRPAYLDSGVTISALHEKQNEAEAHDIYARQGFVALHLADGESVTLLARYEGEIFAAGIYEVSQAATEFGLLFLPRAVSNLILSQASVELWELTELDAPGEGEGEDEEDVAHAAGC